MTAYKKFVLAALFIMTAGAGEIVRAEEPSQKPAFESASLFCDAMKDETLYDEHKFESYKLLIAGKGDWIFRSKSDFKTNFSLPKDTLETLQELDRAMEKKGVRLVMLLTPTRAMMHPAAIRDEDRKTFNYSNPDAVWKSYGALLESLRKRGIDTVGLEKISPDTSFFYHMDHHWNPDGARMAARIVAAYVKRLPEFKDVPKTPFTTKEGGSMAVEGVSKKVFKKLCETEQPPETIIRYSTEQEGSSSSNESDLFGNAPIPEVVLLGTSNSTMEPSNANFEGFLKEELGADILNMSVSGGGLDTAMISYLSSAYYNENPSKIAIWEIPSYYDIQNYKAFFREAVAAAHGSCKGKAVVEAANIKIEDQTVYALEKMASEKLSGKKYYVEIAFSSPVSRSFSVDLRYKGNKDRYKFSKSGRSTGNYFYLELNPEKREVLDKVMLAVPEEMIGQTVTVRLCKKSN